jgi:hypothetical protein
MGSDQVDGLNRSLLSVSSSDGMASASLPVVRNHAKDWEKLISLPRKLKVGADHLEVTEQ